MIEVAYRVSPKVKEAFAKSLFPESIFGSITSAVRDKFVRGTVGDFYDRTEQALNIIGRADIARSQMLTAVSMKFGKVDYVDGDSASAWLGRESIVVIIDVAQPGMDEMDGSRMYVPYEKVELLELASDGGQSHSALYQIFSLEKLRNIDR